MLLGVVNLERPDQLLSLEFRCRQPADGVRGIRRPRRTRFLPVAVHRIGKDNPVRAKARGIAGHGPGLVADCWVKHGGRVGKNVTRYPGVGGEAPSFRPCRFVTTLFPRCHQRRGCPFVTSVVVLVHAGSGANEANRFPIPFLTRPRFVCRLVSPSVRPTELSRTTKIRTAEL